jgi:hypothetical protein
MKIESDCYVTGEATVDHNGDIQIDNLLVDGEKPNEELAEQVYAVIEHEYYGEILESMPTDDDLRSLHDDARWDEYYQSDRYKRRVA